MSFGIPTILSKESFPKGLLKKNQDVLVYSNEKELIKSILYLKENKKISNKLSKNSQKVIKKKFNNSRIFSKYEKIIK